jgi:integrase
VVAKCQKGKKTKVRGSITKRPNRAGRARWAYWFDLGKDENGKRQRISKSGFETKRHAEEAMAQAIAEHRDRPAEKEEKPMPTFAEFFDRWHRDVALRDYERKTSERYLELARYAIKLYGSFPLDCLTTEQLRMDQNHLLDHGGRVTKQHPKGRPLAPKTVRHISFLVQGCLEYGIDCQYLTRNPMRKVKKPKVPRRKPTIIDHNGFKSLLVKTDGLSVYPIILLGNSTAMRRGEMLSLQWSDLDSENGVIHVTKSLEETKAGLRIKGTKSGKARTVDVPSDVLEVLREHKQAQDRHRELYGSDYANLNLIFARPDGSYYSPDKVGTRIRAAMRAAGLSGVSLHSLRHSHISELLAQGVPPTVVAERAGHASAKITLDIYAHALPGGNKAAAKLWNDAMSDVIAESRKEALARKCGMAANGSKESGKIRVISH